MTHKQLRQQRRIQHALSRVLRAVRDAFYIRYAYGLPTVKEPEARRTGYLRLAERQELMQ